MGVFVIAEAGVNHNGDIKLARNLIDVAVEAGADAIKFQTFKAEESTSSYADKAEYQKADGDTESQLEMIKKLELPFEAFKVLKEYAEERGIIFLSTPDGKESLDYLVEMGVELLKIGSTEVTNIPFLKEFARTKIPLILSTGMSDLEEVRNAIDVLQDGGCKKLTLMHCTTSYPTDYADVNLRAMVTMAKEFGLEVGLSDHTISEEAAVMSVALGATYIEKHITLDKNMDGPDHKASMNPKEFKDYVTSIRRAEIILGDGNKVPTKNEREIMKTVRRSILAGRRLEAGTVISEEMLVFKRPGDGISPSQVDKVVGKKIIKAVDMEEKIAWENLV